MRSSWCGCTPRPTLSAPCGSKSTSSTRRPNSASAAPRLMVEVVLPTPPFWLHSAITRAGPCWLSGCRLDQRTTPAGLGRIHRSWLPLGRPRPPIRELGTAQRSRTGSAAGAEASGPTVSESVIETARSSPPGPADSVARLPHAAGPAGRHARSRGFAGRAVGLRCRFSARAPRTWTCRRPRCGEADRAEGLQAPMSSAELPPGASHLGGDRVQVDEGRLGGTGRSGSAAAKPGTSASRPCCRIGQLAR